MADIVVIGALALDRPIWLSGPLLPGARLRGHSQGEALGGRLGGGAANAGVALAGAGHRVALAAFVGSDDDGDAAIAQAKAAGLDVAAVERRAEAGRTLILIDPSGERTVLHLDPRIVTPPRLQPPDSGRTFDGLYVRAAYPGAADWAPACRGPIVAHWPADAFEGPCDLFVGSASDCSEADLADPFGAARAQGGQRVRWMVVTNGADDVVAYGPDGVASATPPRAPVVDATGAGDIFTAGLLDALVGGADMPTALRHACEWGAIAVGENASAPVGRAFPVFRRAST